MKLLDADLNTLKNTYAGGNMGLSHSVKIIAEKIKVLRLQKLSYAGSYQTPARTELINPHPLHVHK